MKRELNVHEGSENGTADREKKAERLMKRRWESGFTVSFLGGTKVAPSLVFV